MNKKFLIFLALVISLVFLVTLSWPDKKLHVVACDVGQGDAFLIIHGNDQVLVDSGPGAKVLDCLSRYLPFWDRTLEMVILTHPQKDHYGGLDDVFEHYNVGAIVATSLESGSEEYQVLEKMVGDQSSEVIRPVSGRRVRVGLISLDILWPSQEFLSAANLSSDSSVLGMSTTGDDPNEFSVVFELDYGDFEALFTGDIGPQIQYMILAQQNLNDIELIKVPHHGSKNGLTEDLLEATKPEVAFIGVGKNSWGHPHREVLDILHKYGVDVYRTDSNSYFELVTDGKTWWINNP